MKNSEKLKQYKTVFIIGGGIAFVIGMFAIIKNSGNTENLKTERHYKKEISTGIESLTPHEMWIENSSNEINDLKKQNKDLQDQLDKVQKIVIGIGRGLHVFDDDKVNNQVNDQVNITEPQKPKIPNLKSNSFMTSNTEGINPMTGKENINAEGQSYDGGQDGEAGSVAKGGISITGMKDIVSYPNNKNIALPQREQEKEHKVDTEKLEKSGIKTIKFSNADNEYDLEENFIFAASYARCALVGSVTVSAGIGASGNPQPVLLRITDYGNLPNKVKGFLKDAMVIGAAYGELSSESVVIRLERIVKIDNKGRVGMDIPVQGYVAGENGDSRIRGLVIDRAGAAMRNAAIGGFFSGVADFMTMNKSSSVKFEPNSGLAQFSPQGSSKMLGQGASKGIGNAVEKYADFYIKRAEQLQPVIQIDGGRKLTVVFTQSVKASAVNLKTVRKNLVTKINWNSRTAISRRRKAK